MTMQKVSVGAILAVAITISVVGVLATSLLITSQTIPNVGNVKSVGVGVYWNAACTQNVTSIDWGFLEPGAVVNVTIYIKNKGNVPVVLSLATANWNPETAHNQITLSWNRENYVLGSGSVVDAVLSLSVSSSVSEITNFSFDIVITGTELP